MNSFKARKAAQEVLEAWTHPGARPDAHDVARRRLRRQWPVLAKALDKLKAASK